MDDESVNINVTNHNKPKRNIKKLSKKQLFTLVIILAIVLLGLGFAYQTNANNRLKKENARLSNPQQTAQAQNEQLIKKVGQIIELPNETPTVATVVDVTKLKDQPFYAKAQNGDNVLFFPQAKKAILYRPSSNKIIEVATFNISNASTTPATDTTNKGTTPTTTKKQ